MARKLRVEYPGAIYHITHRGNAKLPIFSDDHDRERFLMRLAESLDTYNVRLYMFCLMKNHIHLVCETPEGNVSRFMQSLTTGYTVYYNLRHESSGHLFQGRFGSKLVEGDSYLLALTRYVHLNPVYISTVEKLPLKERVARLNSYKWSSYQGYVEETKAFDFVEYDPVLALVDARGRKIASGKYRKFVESGIAKTDDEFKQLKDASQYTIGSPGFDSRIRSLYKKIIEGRDVVEDVSFRNQIDPLPVEAVITAVCEVFDVKEDVVYTRQRGSSVRPVTAKMLCKFAGITQREVAEVLNLKSGVAVSCQLRKLRKKVEDDDELKGQLEKIAGKLELLQGQSRDGVKY